MISRSYYHKSIRKTLVAFASLFNDLEVFDEDASGNIIKTIKIPLTYTQKEKFIQKINDTENKDLEIKVTLPRMGFQMGTPDYDSSRKTNSLDRLVAIDGTKFMFNRVPYTIPFNLYIATRKIDHSLQIIEQILPYFDPSLTVEIKDMDEFDINTKIPFTLQSSDFSIDSDESLLSRRNILWTLGFTAKTYLYKAIRDPQLVKRTLVDIKNTDLVRFYESYMSEIDPRGSYLNDEFIVTENISKESRYYRTFNTVSGDTLQVGLDV
jgi:hypothetical protein